MRHVLRSNESHLIIYHLQFFFRHHLILNVCLKCCMKLKVAFSYVLVCT